MDMPERLWVTKEHHYWPTFRNFVVSSIDHGTEYPQYVRLDIVHRLLVALQWMVDNDDTNEGDIPLDHLGGQTWDEYNSYWIDGLNNAKNVIKQTKEILNEG